jgi:hypothetical protein
VAITNPAIFRVRLKNDSMRCGKLPELRFSGPAMQNRDFRDLFAELNAAGVEYLLVGAHALVVNGHIRATKDLGVLVRPSLDERNRDQSRQE